MMDVLRRFRRWLHRRQIAVSVVVLALLAYVPALSAAPGRMPSDSKLYVYLDPGRFIADTTTTFDPRQFAGWVPHQHIAYLWPTGPWFWLFETIGVPDWIAHRLWIGTLIFLAGTGVRWMCRVLGLAPAAALAGALVYQLSPYLLPYVSRTSVLLLPWAGLGWIVGLTVLASIRGRWRFPAAIALIVLTVGAVNATALAMIVPAPALWLIHAAWQRTITWRRAVSTALKVALLSTAVSLWWMVMLVIQGRAGADVLAYSESLESVSFTSTSTEVTRGLGYWLFYIQDSFARTTTASVDYMISVRTIAAGFVLLAFALLGIVLTRWEHRRFAALLVGTGIVIGVGVHPVDDPSPLVDLLVPDSEGGLALALRSSTRAVPVLLLGLSLAIGSLVTVAAQAPRLTRPVSVRTILAGAIAVLAILNLPALVDGGFVDPALERDQDPPDHWIAAAAALDELPTGYRVLQVPGTEFGAFQWGYTVDQPLPGLTERPLVTRDLLPLGSPAAMDLAFALDDRFQEGTIEVESVAPTARLLGVDTVWVSGDVSFDRFRLARPEIVTDELTGPGAEAVGLVASDTYGDHVVMASRVPMIDELAISDERVGSPIAPITLVSVGDPVPTVRVKDDVLVLSGDGGGIVDAAAAGRLNGAELVLYSASFDEGELPVVLADAGRMIVTDSNRDRAHHWRSSQDVVGFTESGGPGADVLEFDSADQRLPVFDHERPDTQTTSEQVGAVQARASGYGEPFAYLPEHRPVMAIDGDPTTSWVVADRAPAVGEFIELQTTEAVDHVTLRQPDVVEGTRRISRVSLSIDGRPPLLVELDDRSRTGSGQRIDIEPTSGASVLRVVIDATDDPQPPIGGAIGAVGFAEIDVGLGPTVEVIRPPDVALRARADIDDPPAMDLVFTRLRVDPTDRWRSDPEPELRRVFDLTTREILEPVITLRLDRRADGATLADLLGENVVDNAHLTGVPAARGIAAFDGGAASSWVTPFDGALGSAVTYFGDGSASTISVGQPSGDFSPITHIRITDPTGVSEHELTAPDAEVDLGRTVDLSDVTIEIVGIEPRSTTDRRFGEPVTLPSAISEVRFDGATPRTTSSDQLRADCRDDLLALDGRALAVSFEISSSSALTGSPIPTTVCGDQVVELDIGEHTVESGPAVDLDVDRVSLVSPEVPVPAATGDDVAAVDPTATVLVEESRHSRTLDVPPCPSGCWIVLGEGLNAQWSASADGRDLGPPRLVDGNANGWFLDPSEETTRVEIEWNAQRPLDVALALSALAVIICLALIFADRRRDDDLERLAPARIGTSTSAPAPLALSSVLVGGLVTVVASALLIGWEWAIPAAVVWIGATAVRRPGLAGWIGAATVIVAGVIVAWVVRVERPIPDAGWPIRFEWLHPWTLLGVVLLSCSTLLARDATIEIEDHTEGRGA